MLRYVVSCYVMLRYIVPDIVDSKCASFLKIKSLVSSLNCLTPMYWHSVRISSTTAVPSFTQLYKRRTSINWVFVDIFCCLFPYSCFLPVCINPEQELTVQLHYKRTDASLLFVFVSHPKWIYWVFFSHSFHIKHRIVWGHCSDCWCENMDLNSSRLHCCWPSVNPQCEWNEQANLSTALFWVVTQRKTLEEGNERLSRNVGEELPLLDV